MLRPLFSYCLTYSTRLFCSTPTWAFRNSTDFGKSQPDFVLDMIKLKPDRDAAAKIEYRTASLQMFPRGGLLFFGGWHDLLEDYLFVEDKKKREKA